MSASRTSPPTHWHVDAPGHVHSLASIAAFRPATSPSLAQRSSAGLGLQQALGQRQQREGMWSLPFGGRIFPVGGGSLAGTIQMSLPSPFSPQLSTRPSPRCRGAWDRAFVTVWFPVLRRAGWRRGRGLPDPRQFPLYLLRVRFFSKISFEQNSGH